MIAEAMARMGAASSVVAGRSTSAESEAADIGGTVAPDGRSTVVCSRFRPANTAWFSYVRRYTAGPAWRCCAGQGRPGVRHRAPS